MVIFLLGCSESFLGELDSCSRGTEEGREGGRKGFLDKRAVVQLTVPLSWRNEYSFSRWSLPAVIWLFFHFSGRKLSSALGPGAGAGVGGAGGGGQGWSSHCEHALGFEVPEASELGPGQGWVDT